MGVWGRQRCFYKQGNNLDIQIRLDLFSKDFCIYIYININNNDNNNSNNSNNNTCIIILLILKNRCSW